MNEPETPAAHHKFGPSSLKNREICPGWKNDQSGDKSAATEGTLMHLAFEKRDLSLLQTDEQKEQVGRCIRYADRLEKGALTVLREVRLTVLEGQTFGTADLVILRRLPNGKLHIDVLDEKYGRGDIDPAEDNRQGFAYVLGAFDLPGEWHKAETCTVHFLVPRRDWISTHTFTRADLPRLGLIVSSIIARAQHWDTNRNPAALRLVESNCMWCARRGDGSCPAAVNFQIAHAKKYRPLEIADEVHSSQITDPVKMGQFYVALRVLEKMVDSGKKHVAEFALTNDIPGFSRRERKGKVSLTNSVAAWGVLRQQFKIESLDSPVLTDLINCATFSYSDVVKVLAANVPAGKARTEALSKLWIALQDAECVRESEPTPYLQRDKADAVLEIEASPA